MEWLGIDAVSFFGVGVAVLLALLAVGAIIATVIGFLLVFLFLKTRKILIPQVTIIILSILEAPIKQLLWLFHIDEKYLDYMIVEMRNVLYLPRYSEIPYTERVLFMPQCLRSPKCPAPLNEEGIQCKNCGRCGLGMIKEEAEQLGYKFFIAPGATLIKRMVKRYKPKALLGVGCHMEVKEGSEQIVAYGIPAQGVILERDGCVNTRVNVNKLLERIKTHKSLGRYRIEDDEEYLKKAEEISRRWDDTTPKEVEIKEMRKAYKRD